MAGNFENFSAYQLLDSGEGFRLEQFGDVVLSRPASLAIWKKMKDRAAWGKARAAYEPAGGWKFWGKPFESWIFDSGFALMELRLQKSGHVGLFPDHAIYLDELRKTGSRLAAAKKKEGVKVLNLFAYTGMASVMLAREGAHVCHVDLAKQALNWTAKNLEHNTSARPMDVRLICDDALEFVKREVRRKNTYDIVIADPPSFGRISKSRSWKLEDIAEELIQSCLKLLCPEAGALFLLATTQLWELKSWAIFYWTCPPPAERFQRDLFS